LVADFAEGGEVEAGGRFVEEESVGVVNEGAGDEEAASFAGGEFVEPAIGEVSNFEAGHGLSGGGLHFGQDVMIGPDADGAEEAREDEFAAFDVAGALGHEVVADEAEVVAEVEDVPIAGAEDLERCFGAEERVAFAGDGFDERGFAAAVGAEDGDVFAGFDGEVEAVKGEAAAAFDEDVLEFE
jgi:hypothetical protein